MAMIDYGAIAWKDGKLISTDMFTPMKDMVGWTDNHEHKLEGNYFAYIGDEDFTIGFYKDTMRIYSPTNKHCNETFYFSSGPFEKWSKWRKWYLVTSSLSDEVELIVRPHRHHNYYICEMAYRGHKYKVAFGYGVDLTYYKKTHIIDYYGTPWFKIGSLYKDIKYKFEDWKWRKGL